MSSHTIDLDGDTTKYSFFPYESEKLFKLYEAQIANFWTLGDLDLSNDSSDFNMLPQGVKTFITRILAVFSQIDRFVLENISERFQKDTSDVKEASHFYCAQNLIETIHNQVYGTLIITLIQDIDERNKVLDAVKNYPDIRAIAEWMNEWMNPELPLLERIIAFACIEGILFIGMFAGIYWIKHIYKDKLRGLTKSNELIQEDEFMHRDWGFAIYEYYTEDIKKYKPLSGKTIHTIIKSSVEVSSTFINNTLEASLVGLTAEDMINYIKCAADEVAEGFKTFSIYNIPMNPFPWCKMLGLENKTSFFEDKVSEYRKCTNTDWTFNIYTPY